MTEQESCLTMIRNEWQAFCDNKNMPTFGDFYESDDEYLNFDRSNYYSMIHSTGYQDPFHLHLYNGSHRLKNSKSVHAGTKVTIKFPEHSSYFIVFHAHLVHSGGASIVERGEYQHSPRLFSYLRVPPQPIEPTVVQRHTTRVTSNSNNIPEDTVDTHSFKFVCHKNNKCRSCRRAMEEQTTVIELEKFQRNRKQSKIAQNELIHVIGNMHTDGWEIYEGVKFTNRFHIQIREIVTSHNTPFVGISSSNRKMLKLHSLESKKNWRIQSKKAIYGIFEDILNSKLKKIPYLSSNVVMDSTTIIANFSEVFEQTAHRDFNIY